MSKKQFKNKKSFLEWLKSLTKAVIVSITLVGGVSDITYSTVHPRALERISQIDSSFLGEGQYLVEYEEAEDDADEIEYSNFAFAITFEVALANSALNSTMGGRTNLIEALAPFECCYRLDKESAFNIGHIWIKMPSNPIELAELETVLANEAAQYGFPDETGLIHEGNFKQGNGMRLQSKT